MTKSKLSAAIYLLLVFVSGVVVGGFSQRFLVAREVPPPQRTPAEWRQHYVGEVRDKVKLDAQQVTNLERILDETKQRVDQARAQFKTYHDQEHTALQTIQDEQVAKVRSMLRPEQIPVYEQMRAERERKRQEAEKKDREKRGRN
jgi:hypothetical protein